MFHSLSEFLAGFPQAQLGNLFGWYIVIALCFNVISFILLLRIGRTLVPHEPIPGIMNMTMLYLVYAVGPVLNLAVYITILIVFTFLLIMVGLVPHFKGYNAEKYLNIWAWFLPICLNVFGISIILLTVARILLVGPTV